MSCILGDKCENVFVCNIIRPDCEVLGCNFYKPKKPQTNEEWFCQLSTEEKAKAITHEFYIYPKLLERCLKATKNVDRINHIKVAEQVILEWLKQPHTIKE